MKAILIHLYALIFQRHLYYLQHTKAGFVGDAPIWWRKGGSGYVTDLNKAQVWTLEKASQESRASWSSYGFKPVKVTDARRSVDWKIEASMPKLRERGYDTSPMREPPETIS